MAEHIVHAMKWQENSHDICPKWNEWKIGDV